MNRMWQGFGYPIYATLQRYLLLDSWLLSRSCVRKLAGLLLGLLFILLPFVLLAGGACGIHAIGLANLGPCAKITGIYYVDKHVSDGGIVKCYPFRG